MGILQTIKLVLGNIKSNKLRTFLTMLGIIIGVAAVIVMVSIIQSFIDKQMESFGKMGINNVRLTITSKAPPKMSTEDMHEFVKGNKDVFVGVTQSNTFNEPVNIKRGSELSLKTDMTSIMGIDENYIRLLNQSIKAGRDISYADIVSRSKVCIVGGYVTQKAFKTPIKVGEHLFINGIKYEVVGILDNINEELREWGLDNIIYMPLSVIERMPPSENTYYFSTEFSETVEWGNRSYQFVGKDVTKLSKAAEVLRTKMKEVFKNEKLYSIMDSSSMLSQINGMRATSSMVAGGIGMISLFVAGIGIMNIMLVSVTERTREIGIRKSLGAKKRDIRRQFVLEAGITGGLGGLMGIGLGVLAMLLLSPMLKIAPNVSISTILLSFSVSVGVGMVFGFLPANKAAGLNPIDALRAD